MDITPRIELSPQARLALSRKAIFAHMNRNHRHEAEYIGDSTGAPHASGKSASKPSLFNNLKHAARLWWNRHPASAAVELASPFLMDYARANPFKLVGVSAVAGAAVVVLRPWRMVSVSALLVTAVKSSGLSNTLITMLSSFTRHADIHSRR
ncbi:MAG: hypothetical protein JWR74_1410 [Polaromonas sp.]|jgi:hypothetical protein|nr:hypothetical protein [Polaromonas sp.]